MTNLPQWCESQENLAKFWNQWELSRETREDDYFTGLYVKGTNICVGYVYECEQYYNLMVAGLDGLFILLSMKYPGWELTDLEDGRFCLDTNKDSRMEYARTVREAVVAALKGDLE